MGRHPDDHATARVDAWLWAVRVFRTRSAAGDACRRGRVRVGDDPAKPARRIAVGDRVEVRGRDRRLVLEVVDPITKRVGAAVATGCYVDHSPPPQRSKREDLQVPQAQRDKGMGRPTKKDRRAIDRLRGR